MTAQFDCDINIGLKAEYRVAQHIRRCGATCITYNDTSAYDIGYFHRGQHRKLEVKCDIQEWRTGKVAIETASRGRPSGLSVTEAEDWVFVLGDDIYFVEVESELKRMVAGNLEALGIRAVRGGDNNTSELLLFPMAQIAFASHHFKKSLPIWLY